MFEYFHLHRKIIFHKAIYFFILSFLIQSCHNKRLVVYNGFTQGSTFGIKYQALSDSIEINKGIDSILYEVNKAVSLYDTNSLLFKVNNNRDVAANSLFVSLFAKSKIMSKQTMGCFDFTIGELYRQWGFYTDKNQVLSNAKRDSLMKYVGYDKVAIQNSKIKKMYPEIKLDFNAIAQGYTVDLIADYLEKKGCKNYLVEVGGEIRAKGHKPDNSSWLIGIEKPANIDTSDVVVAEKLELADASISTSGITRKYFFKDGKRYSHTLDPISGNIIENDILSVTVIAPYCADADVYCTAFLVMGLTKAKQYLSLHPEIAALFYMSGSNNSLIKYQTKNFPKTKS